MKIAVCIPVYADPKAHLLQSLANLIARTAATEINYNGTLLRPTLRTFVVRGLLPINRNMLAVKALDWGADYLLWADADMAFPEDALLRLLARNVAIVGVNYPRRGGGGFSASVATTEADARADRIEEVEQLGLGLCLIVASVVKRLVQQAKKDGLPLFHFELLADGSYLGEDNFFFGRVRRLGIPVHLDHAVSWGVSHVEDRLLTNDMGRKDADSVPSRSGDQQRRHDLLGGGTLGGRQ